MCLITIIIPVYNAEKWIERCVLSCFAQTYGLFEVVAVNDGSTDNSLGILTSLSKKDARLKVVSIANSGVTVARFTGVANALGEYIFFVDADDFLPPAAIECLILEMGDERPDLVIGEHISCLEGSPPKKAQIIQGCIARGQLEFLRQVLVEGIVPAFSKLIRTDLIRQVKLSPELKWGEDFAMMIQLASLSRNVFVTQHQVYYYMTNPESVTKAAGLDVFLTWRKAMSSSEEFLTNQGLLPCVEKEWRLRELIWELTAYRTALRWNYRTSNLRMCAWKSLVFKPRIGIFVLRNMRWTWNAAFIIALVSPYYAALMLNKYGQYKLKELRRKQKLV